MKSRTITGLVVAAALAFGFTVLTAAQPTFTRIVVFGASLSDSGNAFALRGGRNTPPDYDVDLFLVPSSPYDRGGHHFSNGATWIEQFARVRGLAGSVRPAFASSDSGATNFAVGGARAHEDGINLNLTAQVDEFLQRLGGVAPSDALYVVEMGGNDIRDALVVFAGGGDGGPILVEANTRIADNLFALYLAGARRFLVWRAPDVGLAPAVTALGPQASGLATFLSGQFNDGLDTVVAGLSALPGITIVRLDAFKLLNDIVSAPAAFGLANATLPCVTPNVAPFFCQQPDAYLFWDGIHPTSAGHAILAQEAARVLGQ